MKVSEKKLLEWVNNNNNQGYRILYQEYYSSLVCFSMNYISSLEMAEDIVQETFTKLWKNNHQFDAINALKTFLYTSVRNAALDYLKHLKVEEKYRLYYKNTPEIYEEEIEWKIIEEEVFRKIYKAIHQLPQRCQEIFELHLQGKSNEEIAKLLHLSILTVKTQKNRAIRNLREQLGHILFIIFIHLFSNGENIFK